MEKMCWTLRAEIAGTYVQNKSGYFINVQEGQIQKINKSPVPNKGVQNGKNPQKNKSPLDFY